MTLHHVPDPQQSAMLDFGMAWCPATEATIMWVDTVRLSGATRTISLCRRNKEGFVEVVRTRRGEQLSEPRVDNQGAFYFVRRHGRKGELVRVDCVTGELRVLQTALAKKGILAVARATATAIYCIAMHPPRGSRGARGGTRLLSIDLTRATVANLQRIPVIHAS